MSRSERVPGLMRGPGPASTTIAAVAALCATAAPCAGGDGRAMYEVIELPALGDLVTLTRPRAINDAGVVAGASADDLLTQRAVMWPDGAAGVMNLDPSTKPVPSDARAVSPGGLVAGWLNDPRTNVRAAVWQDGRPTLFDPLGGHIASRAGDVNDSGLVVGWSIDRNGDTTAARWTDGTITPLAGLHSTAVAVNEIGQIIGRHQVGVEGQALLWEGDATRQLPHLGADIASPNAISETGDIVGAALHPKTSKFHAVLWPAPQHEIIDLGLYLDTLPTQAQALNGNGQIVGEAVVNPASGETRAILWQNGDIINLNDAIDPDSPWTLQTARGINNDGVIVGWGVRQDAVGTRGYMLVPVPANGTDLDGDGTVNVADLLILLAAWGSCDSCAADFDGDGAVDVSDLLQLLADFSA